ncbi:MAG: hypothetical protein ACRCZ2_10150 [Fusobacteriaceae bacterium]
MLAISIVSGAIIGIVVFELFKRKLKRDIEGNCYKYNLEKVLLKRGINELKDEISKLKRDKSDLMDDIYALSRAIEIVSLKKVEEV